MKSQEGKIFRRIHDGFIMGNEIFLGYDYSTGTKRLDLPEYYEEIDEIKNEESQIEEL